MTAPCVELPPNGKEPAYAGDWVSILTPCRTGCNLEQLASTPEGVQKLLQVAPRAYGPAGPRFAPPREAVCG